MIFISYREYRFKIQEIDPHIEMNGESSFITMQFRGKYIWEGVLHSASMYNIITENYFYYRVNRVKMVCRKRIFMEQSH